MRLRTRLLVLSVSTVAVIVAVLFALHLESKARDWLDSAVEHSTKAGKDIQSQIVRLISDNPDSEAATSMAQTKRMWSRIVATDKDLADMLVKEAAEQSGVIVEINIIGEDGRVLVSSIPSRQGQVAPVRANLATIRDSGPVGRLAAIATSHTDWETRVPLGILDIPKQTKPVFDIQLLASPILLRDNILPDLEETAFILLFALLAAAGLAGVSAHLALRPVERIGKAIDTLTTGNPLGLSTPRRSREDREVAAVEYKLSLLGEQMHGARRDADQMRTAIGSLARGVAHEIRNPLNAITLRLETLRMRIADEVPEAEGEIDLVSNEVRRLDRVVRTFLDLNRPMEPDISKFDPAGLAAAVLEVIRPAATQVRVELRLIQPSTLFTVHADRGLIEQSLLNVVNNAIQAMDGGGLVTTSVSLTKGICEIMVTDNGPGMPDSVRERIFEPYFTTKSTGSGIGLAFTKRAMELHRGRVSVASTPGHGTTLVLAFPAGGDRA